MRSALRQNPAEAPAPQGALQTEHVLSGHSGARIVLYAGARESFVRKTVSGTAASFRLKAQADKQHAFWMFGLPFPKVRQQFSDAAGVSGFDMNYIPGQTIANAVVNGGAFDPAMVAKAVERLMRLFTMSAGVALDASLFEAKIHEIARRMETLAARFALKHEIHRRAQTLLDLDWTGIPESPCHGDLTLENILLTTGKSVAFIDCDMAFVSSWWLDLGKLFQDIEGHWCIRSLYEAGENIRLLNASQKLDQLGTRFRALAGEMDNELPARLPQLAALGLFRALPYAQNSSTQQFLCERIAHVLGAHNAAAR